MVNASLSSIEVEAILREKVRAKHQNIMQVSGSQHQGRELYRTVCI